MGEDKIRAEGTRTQLGICMRANWGTEILTTVATNNQQQEQIKSSHFMLQK